MARPRPDLSLTDWSVLGIVAEGSTHGWAVARELAPDGSLGRIWTVRRPLVYRAIDNLTAHGYVEACGEEPSVRGPARSLVRVTASGRRALRRWLTEPVEHIRDVRSEFLMKLALLDRAGIASDDLVRRQNIVLAPVFAALDKRSPAGFEGVHARWRRESARAVQRFLRSL